jgi:hypothetical protein
VYRHAEDISVCKPLCSNNLCSLKENIGSVKVQFFCVDFLTLSRLAYEGFSDLTQHFHCFSISIDYQPILKMSMLQRWDRCVQMGWVCTGGMGVYRLDGYVQMGQVCTDGMGVDR